MDFIVTVHREYIQKTNTTSSPLSKTERPSGEVDSTHMFSITEYLHFTHVTVQTPTHFVTSSIFKGRQPSSCRLEITFSFHIGSRLRKALVFLSSWLRPIRTRSS